jgi:hypothetical protein
MSKPMSYYETLTASQLITEFEREIPSSHIGMFYRWLGLEFDERTDRLEEACNKFLESDRSAKSIVEFHKAQCEHFKFLIDMAHWYKKEKGIDETKTFLQSLIIE